MFLKGMMITNQLLYQLSYKGMQRYINQKQLPIVTDISYSNRTRNPIWNEISKLFLFLTKTQNKRNEHDTEKKKK
jgi:hypothetical protein